MKRLTAFFFLICFYSAGAQTLAAIPDKKTILIGEPLHLQLFGEFKKGQSLAWFQVDSLPHFEIMERSRIDTVDNGTVLTLKQTITLTSWDSGKWVLPPLVIGKARTAALTLSVGYSPMDPAQPYHDMKDIIGIDQPVESKWYWYVLFGLILIILFMLFFPRQKKQEQKGFVPQAGAYKVALQKLETLRAQPVTDQKVFYTQLVDAFREYLEKRKNIRSFSRTTDDLALQIGELKLERESYQSLLQSLRLSDLVKFARFQPEASENKKSIDIIEENIHAIERMS